MNDWNCPECGRPWVRNFVFDHARNACTIGDAEDATQYADHRRLSTRSQYFRDATPAEIQLADMIRGFPLPRAAQYVAPGMPAPASDLPQTEVIGIAAGIHKRIVVGVDPDTIEPIEETE